MAGMKKREENMSNLSVKERQLGKRTIFRLDELGEEISFDDVKPGDLCALISILGDKDPYIHLYTGDFFKPEGNEKTNTLGMIYSLNIDKTKIFTYWAISKHSKIGNFFKKNGLYNLDRSEIIDQINFWMRNTGSSEEREELLSSFYKEVKLFLKPSKDKK